MSVDAVWRIGDAVSYDVEVDLGGERHAYVFSLTVEQLPPPGTRNMSDPIFGGIRTRTADFHVQFAPDMVPFYGGTATLRARLADPGRSSCDGVLDAKTIAHVYQTDIGIAGLEGMHEVFAALLRLPCVYDHLMAVIRAPSAWSIARRLGRVEVELRFPPGKCDPIQVEDTPFGRQPAMWCPFEMNANGQPALDGRVQFTWKRSPLLHAAGVLQVDAWRPDDPTRQLTARLHSARRGSSPPDDPGNAFDYDGLCAGMSRAEVESRDVGTLQPARRRGRLADGRAIEILQFDSPRCLLFAVFADERLVYADVFDESVAIFLAHRGFEPEADGAGSRAATTRPSRLDP